MRDWFCVLRRAPVGCGHQHTVLGHPHITVEVIRQVFHNAGDGQLGHEAKATHVDAQQRYAQRCDGPIDPQDGAVAADGYHQIGALSALSQALGVLSRKNPGIRTQVEFADDGMGQVQGLGNQIVIGDSYGWHDLPAAGQYGYCTLGS